jgi:hypothetical protein
MRRYLLREYGSWGVMTLSFLTGVFVGGVFQWSLVPAYIATCLLVNSKQAFTRCVRGGGEGMKVHAWAFVIQTALAAATLLLLLSGGIGKLLPLAAIPAVYAVLFYIAGEHAIATEITGFGLLSAAAIVSRFLASGQADYRLYAAAFLFFGAGVFKVRIQLTKRILSRAMMVLYLLGVVEAYFLIEAPFVALLPLLDNLVFAIAPYRTRLRTAGWAEVVKGAFFLVLMALFY